MKTSERDLSEVEALFALPIEDDADMAAVSEEFSRRTQRMAQTFRKANAEREPAPTLMQRLKAWWRK